jgi:hypothetical protein
VSIKPPFDYKKYLLPALLAIVFVIAIYGAFYGSPFFYVVSGTVRATS